MTPSVTATALFHERDASTVKTGPFTKTRSAVRDPASASAERAAEGSDPRTPLRDNVGSVTGLVDVEVRITLEENTDSKP
jgi:hypothetical protein